MKTKYLAIIGLILIIAGVCAAIGYPRFKEKRRIAMGYHCCSNLKMIDGAKEEAISRLGLKAGESISEAEVAKYCKDGVLPKCPSGGTYSINPVGKCPKCSMGITNVIKPVDYSTHRLPIGD